MNQTHFRKLERMYLQANVNRIIFDTTTIKIEEGRAEIEMIRLTLPLIHWLRITFC
jgi:hypothetical protein